MSTYKESHPVGEEWVDPVVGPVRRIPKPTPWQLPRGNSLMKEASTSDATHHFFMLGSQYYVAGRYAAFAGLVPIVGNLLHHAVEMLIKGALSKSNSLDDLRRIGHKLPKLWDAFKQRANDVSLVRFDALIDRLDSFEELRYPDNMADGMVSTIAITKADLPRTAIGPDAATSVREYRLCLEEINELTAMIFRIRGYDPTLFLPRLKEEARQYINKENTAFSVAAISAASSAGLASSATKASTTNERAAPPQTSLSKPPLRPVER